MHYVFARIGLDKRALRDRVGDTHIKRQAAIELDLLIEEGDGLGCRKPQLLKDIFNFVLEAGVNPRPNHGGLVHGHLHTGR